METVGGRIDRGCLTRGCIDSRLRSWLVGIQAGACFGELDGLIQLSV